MRGTSIRGGCLQRERRSNAPPRKLAKARSDPPSGRVNWCNLGFHSLRRFTSLRCKIFLRQRFSTSRFNASSSVITLRLMPSSVESGLGGPSRRQLWRKECRNTSVSVAAWQLSDYELRLFVSVKARCDKVLSLSVCR